MTIILGFALIAAAAAYGHGSSYAKRSDSHGHHTEISVSGHHGGHGGDEHGHDGGHGHGHEYHHVDYIHHPSYMYEYGVHDPKTKDHHS